MKKPIYRAQRRGAAFTLVEVLVVMTIVSLMVSILLPAIGRAKGLARTTQCAAYQRQHLLYFSQYFADCKEKLPNPTSIHRSGNTGSWGTIHLSMLTTNGSAGAACPEGVQPRTLPTGFGWFFYQGYVPRLVAKAKLGQWDCPDAPIYAPWGYARVSIAQGRELFYSGFSGIANIIAAKQLSTGINPEGGNWDCVGYGASGYYYRGYYKTNAKQSMNLRDWGPNNAMEVCYESTSSNGLQDVHGDGFNIGFFDGHVGFGGKAINGLPAYVYYSMTYNGYSLSAADGTAGTGSHNGWAYAGGNGTNRMWTYYETGNP